MDGGRAAGTSFSAVPLSQAKKRAAQTLCLAARCVGICRYFLKRKNWEPAAGVIVVEPAAVIGLGTPVTGDQEADVPIVALDSRTKPAESAPQEMVRVDPCFARINEGGSALALANCTALTGGK